MRARTPSFCNHKHADCAGGWCADRSKVHKFLKHLLTVCWALTASLAVIIARALWSSLLNLSVGNVALGCGAQTRTYGVSWQVLALARHGQLPCNVPGERLQRTYKQSF